MNRALVFFTWLAVFLLAGSLRFADLGDRPIHFDESTGARLLAMRMVGDGGKFNPTHYHGPLQAQAASVIARVRGEREWHQLSKTTLRLLPALAGCLLVVLPLFVRKRWGEFVALTMASLLATSPLLIYYSRMFIHEMLLAVCGGGILLLLTGKPRPILVGFLLGLMFAAKETVAISVVAWLAAGVAVWLSQRPPLGRAEIWAWLKSHQRSLGMAIVTALATSALFYSDFGRNPAGLIDAIRTFFVYETVAGHEKSFSYYLELLIIPHRAGGVWWFGTPLVLLAVLAWWKSVWGTPCESSSAIQFLFYSAIGHFLIYSLIPYKTPWLMCLPWVHVCLVAGFAVKLSPRMPAAIVGSLVVFALATQWRQSQWALGRYESDERNPFAYVPTSRNVEQLAPWLEDLTTKAEPLIDRPILVLGGPMWPLPWVLRNVETHYSSTTPQDLEASPIIIATFDQAETLVSRLEANHEIFQRTLRAGVPFYVWVRNDVWEAWNQPQPE